MYISILPAEYVGKGISLESIGLTGYVWEYETALKIIEYLSEREYAILGGDVLNLKLEHTYSNWYYTYNTDISANENLIKSSEKAVEYLNWHNEKYGNDFYYKIVATKKADFMLVSD